jgi:hypothetical protein
MGCCHKAMSPEGNMELHRRYYSTGLSNPRESLKNQFKYELSLKNTKSNSIIEIPKTREVRVPNSEVPLEIVKNKKRLSLTIFESKYLSEGTVLNINPGGLEGSERMCRDGVCIFGTKNEEIVNDFNFPDEDAMGKRHFEIKYDISRDVYKIKNLFGSGLFVKIKHKLV